MTNPEKLSLKWNDFQENISTAFGSMRSDDDFSDVTLLCEDGKQVEAHKVILAASSPFFQNLLRKNKHSNPLIYMRGIKFENLVAIVDFMYRGEANVYQQNLNDFLKIAEELKLQGILNEENETTEDDIPIENIFSFEEPTKKFTSMKIIEENKFNQEYVMSDFKEQNKLSGNSVYSEELKDLDSKIKSMMSSSSQIMANGEKAQSKCNVCGKKGRHHVIKDHIEVHHIDGISHPCNLCDKTSRYLKSLKM